VRDEVEARLQRDWALTIFTVGERRQESEGMGWRWRGFTRAILVALLMSGTSPALAGGAVVMLGQPTPVLVPPPEFIPAPIAPLNGAPAPKITPLPPLTIEVAPVVVLPVPPRVSSARK
jgi:hypothetical protein